MKYNNFTFLDIETSGTSFRRDHIIEIGMLRVENNTVVKEFQSLVNPQTYVSPFIEEMTGIHKEELESAPVFSDIKDEVLDMLQDSILVAHNVRFDYGFLKREFNWLGQKFSTRHCCSVKLSRFLYPQHRRHNLDALISRFNFSCERRHRAFDDAKVLWDFFQAIQKQFPSEDLEQALSRVMKHTSLPITIPQETIDALPESPGVYLFYGENDTPLYIGKSINIRDRVLSHFANDHSSPTEMKITQQIKRIETIPTAGELGALCKESLLVKQMQPLYNRQLRNAKKLIKLVQRQTPEGYTKISQEVVSTITSEETKDIVGIFTSKKQAEEFLFAVAKEHKLCHKLLGIENTKTACFMERLGECKGACINKELPVAYNMRCIMAFSEKKIKRWPFQGPIAIEEVSEDADKREVFIVDNWCLLDNFLPLLEGEGWDEGKSLINSYQQQSNYTFDVDLYKILTRYLLNKGNYKYVKVLNNYSFKSA